MRNKHLKNLYFEIKMTLSYIKFNLISAMELRAAFLMQVIGMMINNLSFMAIWIIFFKSFGSINGWNNKEVIALQGFLAFAYGTVFAFFSGVGQLPLVIFNGTFDQLLLTPRNLYLRILSLTSKPSAVGDIFYGIITLIIYVILGQLSFLQILLFGSLLIPAIIIIANFALLASCIGFFIPDSFEVTQYVFEIMFGPSLYPAGVYHGISRFVFLFVLPSLAIAGLPVEAAKELNFIKVIIIWSLAICWTVLTLWVLKLGVKKYESTNLTGARVL